MSPCAEEAVVASGLIFYDSLGILVTDLPP